MERIRVGVFIVVLLCIISIVGLLVYQSIWVNKAMALANDQYDHRAIAALNAVSAEYARSQPDFDTSLSEDSLTLSAKLNIDSAKLDSIFAVYIANNRLSQKYKYCIVNVPDMGTACNLADLGADYYTVPLSQLLKNDSIEGLNSMQLRLYFLDKEYYILCEIWQWLLAYVLFIVIVVFSLLFLIRTILRQKRFAKEQADFIHSMIHELKTPVATIGMSSKVLKKAGISVTDFDKLRNYAEIVDEENNRIWACVDSLLQMLTVNKRTLNLKKELVDVNSVVKAAVDGFSVATMARPVTFSLLLEDELPNILADKMHVRAVIDNIIDNAIKYSPLNSSISIKTKQQLEKYVVIIIEDNGRGIAKRDRRRIFRKYYRVASERKKGIKGFGLGLYYIKQVVDAHNGRVYVRSKLNKGTQIGVLLPIE